MSSVKTGTSPEMLVQRSTDAYNAHDAAAFAAVYAPDLQLFDFGGELYLFGRDALRERYAQLFASAPNVAVEIRKRIVVGNVVIDEEYITGTASGRSTHLAVMYEIAGDLIRRVWVARE